MKSVEMYTEYNVFLVFLPIKFKAMWLIMILYFCPIFSVDVQLIFAH